MADCKTLLFKASDGATLPVQIWHRAGGATPAVFLHSLFFDGSMFDACIHHFGGERTLMAPTFRGQGAAELGQFAPTVDQLARDLKDQIDELGFGQVHLIGSSMGAYVAMEYLAAERDHVASLTLSCCTAQREPNPERFAALSDVIGRGPNDETAMRIANIMFGQALLQTRSALIAQWIETFADTPAGMSKVIDAMFAHAGYGDILKRYDGPALLFAGSEDRAKSLQDMQHIAGYLGDVQLIELARVGHTPPVEAPDDFAVPLAAFLSDVDSRGAASKGVHAHVN